jgi:hypothetical protein
MGAETPEEQPTQLMFQMMHLGRGSQWKRAAKKSRAVHFLQGLCQSIRLLGSQGRSSKIMKIKTQAANGAQHGHPDIPCKK